MTDAATRRVDGRRVAGRPLNFYEVLQVSRGASPDVIQAAYRVLAQKIHPDHNHRPDAPAQMSHINTAYEVLSDPLRRSQYDADLDRSASRTRLLRPTAMPVRTTPLLTKPRDTQAREFRARSGSPLRACLLAAVILALVAGLLVVLWLAYDALDEGSPYVVGTHSGPPLSNRPAQPVLNLG